MKRGLQEGFDITKLVGVLALAAFSTVALAGIEDGSDPTGPVGGRLYTDERSGGDVKGVEPIGGDAASADGCAQMDCNTGCRDMIAGYPGCWITYAACYTQGTGEPMCSCGWDCHPVGGKLRTPSMACAAIVDSSDGR
jgi:hypothetical protein